MIKKIVFFLPLFLSALGCHRIDRIQTQTTPDQWLQTHPYLAMNFGSSKVILAEPSSSFIVFLLAFVILFIGVLFLKNRSQEKSRFWWGVALIAWSISTFAAGISYQIFSFEIKCAGNPVCVWTSWWELWYMILMVSAMNGILAATAYTSALSEKSKKRMHFYALVNLVVYVLVLFTGAIIPQSLLISFEFMLLFAGPPMVVMFIVNLKNYKKTKNELELNLTRAWVYMALVMVAYFGYLLSGLGQMLWKQGIWFNANDVLHVALILWMVYIGLRVRPHVQDND